MLTSLAPDLWVATHKLRFYGMPMVTRMTAVRLADGGLLLHSPVPRTDELDREVRAKGPVRWMVAPNRFHHLYAGQWLGPEARLYGAPGLAGKRKDLRFDAALGPVAPEGWAGQLDQELVEGIRLLTEVVFFHRASRTLVVSDLVFNFPPTRSLLVRLARLLEDCDGKLVVPRLVRLVAWDRRALARSVQRILAWDFDRVVMAHGDVVETGGHAKVEAALNRLVHRI